MRCPHCGKELAEQARYCTECGGLLDAQETPARMQLPVPGTQTAEPDALVPAQDVQSPAPVAGARRRPRKGRTTFLLSMLAQVLVVAFEVVGVIVCLLLHADESYGASLGGAVGAVVAIALMGGISLFAVRKGVLKESLRRGWWFLVVNCGLMVFSVVDFVLDDSMTVADGWPLRTLGLFVLCLGIGVAEEGMFRGLLLHGMLDAFGRTRRRVHAVIIVTSVLFGLAHIDFALLSVSDPMSLLQAVLKIVQTGLLGYLLAVLTLHTKSLVGCALLHGLGDFVLMIVSIGLCGDSLDVSYVASGSEGVETAILYAVIIVLYIPLAVIGYRLLRNINPPQYGAFHQE
ncbi:MAG: CPBP family glutamic-type intramembrane protease [Coriobacteriales bacterium]|nr:CPBP family glutamic-type intramembrane protease [Coriobacteriales bacterium]